MNKTVKSFVRQFEAIIKGDDSRVKAEKVFRQANSGLSSTISTLGGDTINFEDAVTEAKEALDKARVNYGNSIDDRSQYVTNLLNAKNKVTLAEEAFNKHSAKIVFLKEELENLSQEVEDLG